MGGQVSVSFKLGKYWNTSREARSKYDSVNDFVWNTNEEETPSSQIQGMHSYGAYYVVRTISGS